MSRDLARRAAELNRLKARAQNLAHELLKEQAGKSSQWVRVRLKAIDEIESEIKRLEGRLR